MTIVEDNLKRLYDERAKFWETEGKPLADIANERSLTPEEKTKFDQVERDFDAFGQRIKLLASGVEQERSLTDLSSALQGGERSVPLDPSTRLVNTDTGQPAALRANQSFLSHPAARSRDDSGDMALAMYGNLGEMVRAIVTTGSGGSLVPSTWSAQLIDLARSKSAVVQAGAPIVPMNAKTVNIGRLTGDPTATFRTEGSTITPSDPTFDNITLTAKTQSALVIGSLEWLQDVDNADSIISDAIAQAIAQNLDLNALYGGITTGAGTINLATPPNPRGILAALNATRPANVIGAATNGTVQTTGAYWAELIDLLYTVRDGNEEPNALIWSSKAGRQYAKAVDTTGQPLLLPPDIASVPRYTVNRIPSYTQGSGANMTDVFAGDFSQLIIGQRLGITLQVLSERYAENGQFGIVAHWRGDIQPARSSAFAVYKAIKGAA